MGQPKQLRFSERWKKDMLRLRLDPTLTRDDALTVVGRRNKICGYVLSEGFTAYDYFTQDHIRVKRDGTVEDFPYGVVWAGDCGCAVRRDGIYGILRMKSVNDYPDGLFRAFREGHTQQMWYSHVIGVSYGDAVFYGDLDADSKAG